MELDEALAKSYADIGGSESQIQVQESQLLFTTEVDLSISLWHLDGIGNQQVLGSSGHEDQTEFNTKPSVDWLDDMDYLHIGSVNLCSPEWKLHFVKEGVHDEIFCRIRAVQVNSLLRPGFYESFGIRMDGGGNEAQKTMSGL